MRPKLLKSILFTVILFSTIHFSANSQTYKMKYGDIDMDELAMTVYDNDTSATAVVLGEFGEIKYIFDPYNGSFKISFIRHTRIKILNKKGYEWADHKINLYTGGDEKESVGRVKGSTYNLVNGKIEEEKLSKKSQFREKENDNWDSFVFTMPNVMVGSIIEYTYEFVTPYIYNLPEWYFQYSIPVRWSELNAEIPEYFEYKHLMTGYEGLIVNDFKNGNKFFTYNTKVERNTMGGTVPAGSKQNKIDYKTAIYRMVAKDVPAFIAEPMLTSRNNYISKIKFELSSTNYPNSPTKLYSQSWESINKQLLDNPDFGQRLKGGNFLKDYIESFTIAYPDPLEKMKAIHEFIKYNMKWDEYYNKYTKKNLRTAFNDKSGNVADINLTLILMLRGAGFDANPVILSTRLNGIVNPYYPLLSQFNYVIAQVELNGETYLLDATDPLCPFGILPQRCLNGNGRLISEAGTDWVVLNPGKKYEYTSTLKLEMDDLGQLKGNISNIRKDYAAYNLRTQIDNESSEEDFIDKIETSFIGLEIENYSLINKDSLYKPFIEEYEIVISDKADMAANLIFFNPIFYEQVKSNMFKLKERKYPIDYSYPREEKFILNLKIPEGYEVDELPKPVVVVLPDNSARFSYKLQVVENTLQLLNEISINKTVFVYDEYENLKEFYNKIVEKHAEQVVLKKVN